MKKRDALLRYLEKDTVGEYVPAAFFLHFGSDYHCGEAAVRKHEEFFRFTDMDFVKIQFELKFPKLLIETPDRYERVPCLPLEFYEPQLAVVKGLVAALREEAQVVLTLYSPYMILGQMVGEETLVTHFEQEPDHVFKGLEHVTDSLLKFVHECSHLGLDGFYHSTQGGEAKRFQNRETFLKWIKPTDHLVMNEIDERFGFNILHICDYHQQYGGYDDLSAYHDYPGHVVNVSPEIGGTKLTPAQISQQLERPYMGGLERLGPLAKGTPEEARLAAREALAIRNAKFILGADCTVPATTPWSNLKAAIEEAHGFGSGKLNT